MFCTSFLLYFTTFFMTCSPCLPSTTNAILSSHVELNELVQIEQVETSNSQCNFTLIAPKKVINPYKTEMKNFVPQKPFGSFHQKCTACLAVAYQLIKTIISTIEEFETGQKCQEFVNEKITKNITKLCTNGFKNYDLRKFKESSLITDKHHCTEHVHSTMDGSWTKKLREICSLYTAHMDLDHITNNYAQNPEELYKHLCWGTGIFRDCQNLETTLSIETIRELGDCRTCGGCCEE